MLRKKRVLPKENCYFEVYESVFNFWVVNCGDNPNYGILWNLEAW